MTINFIAEYVEHVGIVEDVRLRVEPSFCVNANLKAFFFDQPHQNLEECFRIVRLIHQLDGAANVAGSLFRHPLYVCSLWVSLLLRFIRNQIEPAIALSQLLKSLSVRSVADQEAQ